MDYEKKYSEALERAKECHVDGLALHQPVKDVLEYIFPELQESEKDFVTTDEFEKDSAIAGHYWAIAKHAFLLGLKAQKGE